MVVDETYKVLIESYDVNGYGVCHINDLVVFVYNALVGEEVICKITNAHKRYAFAECIKVLKRSEHRIEPVCPYYGLCGGCDLMHVDYETECEIKKNKLKLSLRRFPNCKINDIISSKAILGYRNKVMVPFGIDDDDNRIWGFYKKNSHDIISMDKCLISNDLSNKIIHFINRYLNIFHISIYDEVKHSGLFREVMIRYTALNEYMIVLVTTRDYDFSELIKYLIAEFKEIKSIYLNINDKKTNVVLSNEYKLLYGNDTITEDILGLKFNVSPASFLQVNHGQCEKLYTEALRMANILNDMTIIDAYCGMGSITLNLAKKAKFVYGIEIVPQAIENAKKNMILNSIDNVSFICGKCEEEIKKLVSKTNIDVIVFDPPRKGCDIEFLKTVIDMKIPKIVYVSCNIATFARDAEILEKNGYELIEATPVNLFGSTLHVESVCLLTLNEKK